MPWRSPSRQRSDRRAELPPDRRGPPDGWQHNHLRRSGPPPATWYAGWTTVSFLALARIHARGHQPSLATGGFLASHLAMHAPSSTRM
jgi:hypothetical protein